VTLTWTSRGGEVFSVETSFDLGTWLELDDGIPGEIDTTSFTETGIPAGTSRRYYRVTKQ
jgi:hypothetical protein